MCYSLYFHSKLQVPINLPAPLGITRPAGLRSLLLPPGSPDPQRGFHFPPQCDSPKVTSVTLHWTENPTLLSLSISRLPQSKL